MVELVTLSARYRFEPIHEDHDVSHFDCGHQALDTFLHRSALTETRQDLSRTYLLFEIDAADNSFLCGYFTLTADSIYAQSTSDGQSYLYPLVCIQYLAHDRQRRGKGIGSLLLIEALRHTIVAADTVGVSGVHLVSTLEGRPLYESYGFGEHPYWAKNLLLPIADARAAVVVTG